VTIQHDAAQAVGSRYSLAELAREAGVPERRVLLYITEKLLAPAHGAGRGSYYDEAHLARLREIVRLKEMGVRLNELRARFVGAPSAAAADGRDTTWTALAYRPRTDGAAAPDHTDGTTSPRLRAALVFDDADLGVTLIVERARALPDRAALHAALDRALDAYERTHPGAVHPGAPASPPDDATPQRTTPQEEE
jgi:DNA-binding transcriptional MerR regulator